MNCSIGSVNRTCGPLRFLWRLIACHVFAYRPTRKDGAPGIDGVTAADYNLLDLLDRIKSGRYKAPPVRRTYIPKADGSRRRLGIPTFEDNGAAGDPNGAGSGV